MKKILSILLAFTLIFGIGATAFAVEHTDMETITIKKDYKLTNTGTISPAETFVFTITRTSVTDAAVGITDINMPIPTIGTVTYTLDGAAVEPGATKDITVTLPEYTSVGIYTYTIKETAGSNAGVTYYDKDIKLVVTVIQDGNNKLRVAAIHTEVDGAKKADNFPNIYSAGDLAISKTVTGNLGDQSKYFDVTVTLTGDATKTYAESYAVIGGTNTDNPTAIAVGTPMVFKLKHGDTIKIANLPYDVTYTVVENTVYNTAEGYDTAVYAFSDDANKKIDSGLDTVGITNNKNTDVDTGISLDNIPYILLLAGAVIGIGVLFFKKRKNTEY